MFYYIYEFLYPMGKEYRFLKIFNVFQYVTFRTIGAVITALLISFIIGPKIIRYLRAKKVGQYVRELGPKSHYAKSGTPTMGGIIMVIAVLISTLLWARIENKFIWICLCSMLGFGLIGFLDDYLKLIKKSSAGLAAHFKMLGLLIVSVVLSLWIYMEMPSGLAGSLYLPFVPGPIMNMGIFFIFFTMIVMIGASNAVNLTDGLDGLAIGLSLLVVATFSVFAYLTGHYKITSYLNIPFVQGSSELTVFMGALAGSGLGFLWYNSHPAEVFMGDTGSLFLGGSLATVSVILKKEFLLLIVGGVFVIEAASVILQVLIFKKTGKRLFKMAPIHHHFELGGIPESKIITRFWIVGIMLALVGLATLKLQ